MRLARAHVNGEPAAVLDTGDGHALAVVGGRHFADTPELLEAAGGDPSRISAGAPVHADRLLTPVDRPGKVICIGVNYRAHAEETGRPLPEHPMLFPKWHTSLAGPDDEIPLPPESDKVDSEAELAAVIGRRCRRVNPDDAAEVIFGYTAANDVSMRDFQRHTQQFTAGKAWDRSTPVGPFIVPAAELGGARPDVAISGTLNGERRQDSRTSDLIFGVPELIAYITTAMTLEPGDLILTGTPSGVGAASDPPRFARDGDVYEVEIEGIGSLRNTFRDESPGR
ncbi:MAG TPA: fumarylacetoacetate hydrolase family protein [Thermoleophilaceae bacterium]|nr:fumarylacetoacetate hydrolase family protein [Thermoleophilaceae bacterium]